MSNVSISRLVLLMLLAVLLAGCVTMSKKECRSADWYQTGYQDGRQGLERSQIEDIAEDCAKASIAPDRERYFAGREAGLREYCSPGNAFAVGKSGASNPNTCPPEMARRFDANYQAGYRVYEVRQRVDKLESERKSLERKLSHATSDVVRKKIRDDLASNDKRLRAERDALQSLENAGRD